MSIKEKLLRIFTKHPDYFIGCISCSYPFSSKQLKKYANYLLWKESDLSFFMTGLSANIYLDWSLKLLNDYSSKWDWGSISIFIVGEKLWTHDFLDIYENQIDWRCISMNSRIPFTADLIEKHKEKFDWSSLSGNKAILWDRDMIIKYSQRINFSRLSHNENTPWAYSYKCESVFSRSKFPVQKNIDFIENYEDKIDWTCFNFDWTNGLDEQTTDDIIDEFFKTLNNEEEAKRD